MFLVRSERTVDLETKTEAERDKWMTSLQALMDYRKAQKAVSLLCTECYPWSHFAVACFGLTLAGFRIADQHQVRRPLSHGGIKRRRRLCHVSPHSSVLVLISLYSLVCGCARVPSTRAAARSAKRVKERECPK